MRHFLKFELKRKVQRGENTGLRTMPSGSPQVGGAKEDRHHSTGDTSGPKVSKPYWVWTVYSSPDPFSLIVS